MTRAVEAGFGIGRREVMYNDFVVVGPKADPAGITGMNDAIGAFKKIAAAKAIVTGIKYQTEDPWVRHT